MPIHDDLTNNRVQEHAYIYLQLGFSVIPLRPDSKLPAIRWSDYQSRRASSDDVERWFGNGGNTGIGIVTGSISRLAVIDFDDMSRYDAFRQQHPVLGHTLTVKTARGVHLYYRLPERVLLQTRQIPGVDLQVEGRYVVAPPTTINGHTYQVSEPSPPLLLSRHTQKAILAFFDQCAPKHPQRTSNPAENDLSGIERDSRLTPERAIAHYRTLAAQGGRNNALFQTACRCRDDGWWIDKTQSVLVRAHIGSAPPDGHRHESAWIRQQEAERTMASVYSQPARPRRQPTSNEAVSRLPNALREALLGLDMTPVLRVLEGLAIRGVTDGTPICYTEARELLNGIVGKHSIREALASQLPDGTPVFPPITPREANAAVSPTDSLTTNALLSTDQNRNKSTRGRPRQYLQVPSPDDLCDRLGIKAGGTDPVGVEALRGVKRYRARLHRALIERRPAKYSRRWQCDRLSVSVQTLRRYEAAEEIHALPMGHHIRLFWHNLTRQVPQKLDHAPGGHWLETSSGKRYPLKYEVAKWLLARGETVYRAYQEPNFYTVERDPMPMLPLEYTPAYEHRGLDVDAMTTYWETPLQPAVGGNSMPAASTRRKIIGGVRYTTPIRPQQRLGNQTKQQRRYNSAATKTGIIEQVYTWINQQMADRPHLKISKATLGHLVEAHGLHVLRQGFRVLVRRDRIDNPAGWLVTYCRSSSPR